MRMARKIWTIERSLSDSNLCFFQEAIWFRGLKCERTAFGSKGYLGIGVNGEYPWGRHLKIRAFGICRRLFDFMGIIICRVVPALLFFFIALQ